MSNRRLSLYSIDIDVLCSCKQVIIHLQVGSAFFVRTKDTRQNRGTRKYDETLGDLSAWQPYLQTMSGRAANCGVAGLGDSEVIGEVKHRADHPLTFVISFHGVFSRALPQRPKQIR